MIGSVRSVRVWSPHRGSNSAGAHKLQTEPLLMIRPPRGCWFCIMLNACCAQRNEPVRLTATTFDHCSYVRSSIGMLRGAQRPRC